MRSEVIDIIKEHGNIELRAYYKTVCGIHFFYDFQFLNTQALPGSYRIVNAYELLYYLSDQNSHF